MVDRQVFIGNLCNISNDVLRTYCESYGSLSELSINRDKENNVYHCFAFVTFQFTGSTSEFMSNRPHIISGEEVFVKRALPRTTSSIPERLIVTNRLILQNLHKYNKQLVRSYFQKFGFIKKVDTEYGFIDFEDYDDVDRILLARPHYIRDKEIVVTKFVPTEQKDNLDNAFIRSNPHRLSTNHTRRHTNKNEEHDRTTRASTDTIKISCSKKVEKNSCHITSNTKQCDRDGNENEEMNSNYLNDPYEHLEEEFQEYKKAKEIEICTLRMDLERTKKQLIGITQEKLNVLINNQKCFHNELMLRLSSNDTSVHIQTIENQLPSTPDQITKKRKLETSSPSSPIHREYDYYS
ncbi:unnamed protein product [Rotaria socialis]|uniref:RRM domain-containing protein n=1 Tax=Rotaria socialis TaxID=392032 RepID=A0A817PQ84_9BILA|nr:unnamed protein product [Rotaria socialis]CAF3343290.1 unnamed protein product [Rotaria socialis]CAF3419813.1 unnamed protein product [Rotaria socialis]CAF3702499.1 unnamed protein product [Rotaria socialis]CAF4223820.1 unnamed protein product [Rotaria socialis]